MAELTLNSTVAMPKSAVRIPQLGFGVWQSPADVCVQSCLEALRTGYRHIDTAQIYGNEQQVGEAVRQCSLPRKDIFITTKIMFVGSTPEAAYAKCCESVQMLGSSHADGSEDAAAYVDLFLVHSPHGGPEKRKVLWSVLERLLTEGKTRSIGVSNYGIGHIEEMKKYATVWPPHANQIELHPWGQQKECVAYCEKQGIVVEAYCPIVRNKKADDPTLRAVALKHGNATPNQVLLRYALQRGWVPLPKSDTPARIRANADLFSFSLDEADMATLNALDEGSAGSIFLAVNNEVGEAGELSTGRKPIEGMPKPAKLHTVW